MLKRSSSAKSMWKNIISKLFLRTASCSYVSRSQTTLTSFFGSILKSSKRWFYLAPRRSFVLLFCYFFYAEFLLRFSACNAIWRVILLHDWTTSLEIIFQEHEAEPQERGEPEEKLEIEDLPGPVGVSRKRRGAVSAGPITEDEATSYVKKVIWLKGLKDWWGRELVSVRIATTDAALSWLYFDIGRTERLQNHGRPVEGDREKYSVFSPGRKWKKVSGKDAFQLGVLLFDLRKFLGSERKSMLFFLQRYFRCYVFG